MKKVTRSNKALMILSLLFFTSIMVLGVVPFLINGGSMWDYSRLTRAISILFGIGLFLIVVCYFYIAVINSILFRGVTRYLRIIEIISMIAIVQYVIPDETIFDMSTGVIILGIVGLSIIIIDVALFFYFTNDGTSKTLTDEQLSKVISSNVMTNKKDGESLFNITIGIILFLNITNKEMGHFSDYIGLVVVNLFLLYKFVTLTKQKKKNTQIMTAITVVLSVISITLLEVFTAFFSSDELLYVFIILIPTVYLYPIIIRNFYYVTWKDSLE